MTQTELYTIVNEIKNTDVSVDYLFSLLELLVKLAKVQIVSGDSIKDTVEMMATIVAMILVKSDIINDKTIVNNFNAEDIVKMYKSN